MAETSIEVSLVELGNVGPPGPSGNTSHMLRYYSSKEIETGRGGDGVYYLQQVNGRLLLAFPAASVFEFRITEPGTIASIEFFSRDDLESDCTFDVNLGTKLSNVESIYEPESRPVILQNEYSVTSTVNEHVESGQLLTVDIDDADDQLRFLAVVITVEKE